jgi:hypothetical protein
MKGDKFHYNQKLGQFASGMNGDEDLGQDIIMKGDKFHYNQRLVQCKPLKPEPGAPPYWRAYNDCIEEEPAPQTPTKDLPLCRGRRHGDVPGETCRRFVTSTPLHFAQNEGPAHINTPLGVLPTCTGADSDVPETNCTNRRAPICNGKGTNGVAGKGCRSPLPLCAWDAKPGGHGAGGVAGVDCQAPPLPTCGPTTGGQAGTDCTIRAPGAPVTLAEEEEAQENKNVNFLPTCSDRLTVNCQPVCTESETTGCTEIRTPAPLPMRNWDYRDRFEGRKTFQ